MKPIDTTVFHNTSSENIERFGMGIDLTATAHVISLLTDLYSDRMLAVIREYSTNALDSHVEAGNDAPIHIKKPTFDAPMFSVQDFGVGLSKDDLENVYAMYGTSTKRGTNDATGMLGLGCKSALTYALQFTVDSVKDGVRTIAVIAKDSEGVGEIQILMHEEADAPNGVKVSVPVETEDIRDFNEKIDHFFSFWRDGEVMIDGEEIRSQYGFNLTDEEQEEYQGNWKVIDPDVAIQQTTSRYGKRSYIVQGGVAYPFANDWEFDVIAYVPIGTIDFTPSREDLMMNPRTEEVIRDIRNFVDNSLRQSYDDEASKARSDWELMQVHATWDSLLNPRQQTNYYGIHKQRFEYLGSKFGWDTRVNWYFREAAGPGCLELDDGEKTTWWMPESASTRIEILNYRGDLGKNDAVNRINDGRRVIVRNFKPKSVTKAHIRRLAHYGLIGKKCINIIFLPDTYRPNAASIANSINWETVPEIPRSAGGRQRQKGAPTVYPVLIEGRTERELSAFDQAGWTYSYEVHSQRTRALKEAKRRCSPFDSLKTHGRIFLTPRQVDKFKKTFPKIVTRQRFEDRMHKKMAQKVTPEMQYALHADKFRSEMWRKFADLLPDVTNGHFKSFFEDPGNFQYDRDLVNEIRRWGVIIERPDDLPKDENRFEWRERFFKSYPLANVVFDRPNVNRGSSFFRDQAGVDEILRDHLLDYINDRIPVGWPEQQELLSADDQ